MRCRHDHASLPLPSSSHRVIGSPLVVALRRIWRESCRYRDWASSSVVGDGLADDRRSDAPSVPSRDSPRALSTGTLATDSDGCRPGPVGERKYKGRECAKRPDGCELIRWGHRAGVTWTFPSPPSSHLFSTTAIHHPPTLSQLIVGGQIGRCFIPFIC